MQFIPAADHKWRVLDAAGQVVAKGYATRDEAEARLAQHGRDIGRAA